MGASWLRSAAVAAAIGCTGEGLRIRVGIGALGSDDVGSVVAIGRRGAGRPGGGGGWVVEGFVEVDEAKKRHYSDS